MESSELDAVLDAELSQVEEDYFGERNLEQDRELSDDEAAEEGGVAETSTSIEPRELDTKKVQTVQQFLKDTCGCSRKPGKGKQRLPCSRKMN